jgi:hypothetical protein
MVMPVGDLTAGDGDEVRLLRPGERLAITGLPFMTHHRIYAALGEARGR